MSFIVAAASTATVSALTAGAVTTGVAGAITAGSIGAAAGGIAAGAATAGALGAGIGAAGAAITGGDVGKGALSGAVTGAVTGGIAPGLGGATAGLGAVGSGAVTGGIAGAAGSAAGAGAVGEDAGKAALMGGGIGALGGALGGAMKGAPTAGEVAADATDAAGRSAAMGDPNSISDIMNTKGGFGNITNPNTGGVSTADLTPVGDLTKGSGGLSSFNTAPTLPENATQALTNVNSNPVYGGGKIADAVAAASPTMGDRLNLAGDAFKGGMSAVQASPGKALSGIASPLATGVMYGGGLDAAKPKPRTPLESIGGAPLAANFQAIQEPTRDVLPKYYADGGTVPPQPTQDNKMNPFASMGMEAAQIGQQTVQQQQAQQPQPQVQQGIVPPAPIAPQPAMQQPQNQQPKFYADGGAVATTNGQGSFADQVRALAAQQVQAHYAQQAQQLSAQQQAQAQPQQPRMYANGGITGDNLGDYSHGGIAGLTSAVGSGVSDEIPAQIGDSGKQPARLAANEFVIPARAVSELGQGSSEAGAKQLQAMVDRIQAGRKKSIGKGKIAVDSKATKNLPA